MPFVNSIKHLYRRYRQKQTEPGAAYDLWAGQYDDQSGNLMLALDEQLFSGLLNRIEVEHKKIADIGCGTGRHWPTILQKKPAGLYGYDLSNQMLRQLLIKFPEAKTARLGADSTLPCDDRSFDLVISTLTIAHIKDIAHALKEWNRVLKPGGNMIITDYHPVALAKGGNRTFRYKDQLIAVKNHVHSIAKVQAITARLALEPTGFVERRVDESVKSYYQHKNALSLYKEFEGTPIIYGLHLKKPDAAA
jgi:ubiquinone/menaquinone biosynthesis C-methylase UbiE